ncbi:MAG: hypothetical protein HY913_05465 [Desulfomonile tiedjei]|nr:hypothetical protein [Desulfomonile tiedjei]
MKKRRLSQSLAQRLERLRTTRKSFLDYDKNFLMNFCEQASFMHYVLSMKPVKQKMVTIAAAGYMVSLVTCWETFFRDVFICLCELDKTFGAKCLDMTKAKDDLGRQCRGDIKVSEYLSQHFNFQNEHDIEEAFAPLFEGRLLESVMSYEIPLVAVLDAVVRGFRLDGFFPHWRELVNLCFEQRHEIIHDANYRPKIPRNRMGELEALFLLVPQVFTVWLIYRYGQERLSEKNFIFFEIKTADIRCPYLFSMRDVLSDDWEVTEEQDSEVGLVMGPAARMGTVPEHISCPRVVFRSDADPDSGT